MKNSFEIQNSEIYNIVYSDKDYKKESNFIINQINKLAYSKIKMLEIGSGTGNLTEYLIQNPYEITCLEPNKDFFSFSKMKFKKNKNINFINDSLESFFRTTSNRFFNVLIANFNVINYIKFEDFKNLLFEIHQKTDENTIFIFDTWSLEFVKNNSYKRFSMREFKLPNKLGSSIKRESRSFFKSLDNCLEISFKFSLKENNKEIKMGLEKHNIYPYPIENIKHHFLRISNLWRLKCLKSYEEINENNLSKSNQNQFSSFRNWYIILEKV